MPTFEAGYFTAYPHLKITRDGNGVLVAEFHTNGGSFVMSAQAHTEFVDAFYRIAQDRDNKIVILTGAGRDFITDVDWPTFGDVADPGIWSQVHDEGVQVLENIANIRVPVIAAVEGRAHVHSDYALLAASLLLQKPPLSVMRPISSPVSHPGTASSPHGVIAPAPDVRKLCCSILSPCPRAPPMNGGSSPRSYPMGVRWQGPRNLPSST
jgi:hypothetical protein